MSLQPSRWRAFKAFWYQRVRPVWLDIRPLALALATVAVLVLGVIGFQQYGSHHHLQPSFLDSLYRTIVLFQFGGSGVVSPIPWTLQVARFLAPLLVGYALFRGLLAVFRNQAQLVGIRLLTRRHVVVAGLGQMGFQLASDFRGRGFRVIVIEIDEGNGRIQSARERGISVLSGDARDRRMLARARAERARYLIATCGDDGRNVEVAVAAARLSEKRGAGKLHVLVDLQDPGLWRMLKVEAISRFGHEGVRVEFFNVSAIAARILLDERPPFAAVATPTSPRRPHVLIAGLEGLGDALVLNVARLWQGSQPAQGEDLRLTILVPDADEARRSLLARYPELERICDVGTVAAALDVELQRGTLGIDTKGEPAGRPITSVYVCLNEEAQSLEVALALRARAELRGVPFAVAVSDVGAGLATILHDDPETIHGVYGFGVLGAALGVEALLRGTNESLARAKHEEYIRHQLARGVAIGEGLMVPWEQLDEGWKDANRAFADGIGAQLAATGCVLVPAPLIDPRGPLFSFTDSEVETLARSEHDRWVADKVRSGWHHGPERDDDRKVHPGIVDWEQLPEFERDKDREPIREIPEMLAYAGLEIVRVDSAGGPEPAQPPSPTSNAPLTPASSALSR